MGNFCVAVKSKKRKNILEGGSSANLTISDNDGKIPYDFIDLSYTSVKEYLEQAMVNASLHGFKRSVVDVSEYDITEY